MESKPLAKRENSRSPRTSKAPKALRIQLRVEQEIRLDLALLHEIQKEYPQASRSLLKKWFTQGKILLDDKKAHGSLLLHPGEPRGVSQESPQVSPKIVTLLLDPKELLPAQAKASPRGCFLPILFENERLLILNKASGIPSVPQSADETETVVGAALAHFPSLAEIGPNPLEAGLLHRLDTGTSGAIAFAKTTAEYERLRHLWKQRDGIRKIYRAWARRGPATIPAIPLNLSSLPHAIRWELAHNARSARKMIALLPKAQYPGPLEIRGKPLRAETMILGIHSRVPTEEGTQGDQPVLLDLEIAITTGVMHQIRCHLAAAGWPILGDRVYAKASEAPPLAGATERPGLPDRLWLHAWKLELPHGDQSLLKIEAPLPDGWSGI